MLNQSISASNLSALGRDDLRAIADAAQVALRDADNAEKLEVLNSSNDNEIIDYFRKHCGIVSNAVGQQKWYKENRLINHYLVSPFVFDYHPNSPVLMRGSIEVMAHKYGSGNFNVSRNGLAYAILERFAKFYKLTVTNEDERKNILEPFARKLSQRFGCSYHYSQNLLSSHHWPKDAVLIRGKIIWLEENSQAIVKSIYRHYKKLERVA